MRTICIAAVLALGADAWAAEGVDVKITPAIREYCHIIRFPQGFNQALWVTERYFILPSANTGSAALSAASIAPTGSEA